MGCRFQAKLTCCVLAAACAREPDQGDRDGVPRQDDTEDVFSSGCGAVTDRPPGDKQEWNYVGPSDADVSWGIQPSVIWDGPAAWIAAGPQGGCNPCEFQQSHSVQFSRVAADLAVELEMGCAAELLTPERTRAIAGLRLHVKGPSQRLRDDTDGILDLHDLPLDLTTTDAVGDGCVATTDPSGFATASVRDGAQQLEPGRFLTWRAELDPLIRAAGMDPVTTVVDHVDVDLVVYNDVGATAWIELGRTFLEACP